MATNNLLQTAVDAVVTRLEFTAMNDFPQYGICQIGTELIKYVESNDQGIAGCIRGYAGTVAAVHAKSAPVLFIEDKEAPGDALRLTFQVCAISGIANPVDGTSGDGAGFADIGSLYVQKTTGKHYVNGGTMASPVWKLVTSAA